MESGQKIPSPKLIKPGDMFGENDLKSGMTRQSNVVTKSSVDLLYLHKFVSMTMTTLNVVAKI